MRRKLELAGLKFGRWNVLSFSHKNERGEKHWNCKCDCGTEAKVVANSLVNGRSISCGCFQKERVSHHGMTGVPTFKSWESMKQRCLNPNSPDYERYGARGIKVCERWLHSFDAFFEDMGIRPEGMTLDRINNDGNYEPSNCKWSSVSDQLRNRRVTKRYLWEGTMKCVSELAEISGIKPSILHNRFKSGWSVEKAMSTPNRKQKPIHI